MLGFKDKNKKFHPIGISNRVQGVKSSAFSEGKTEHRFKKRSDMIVPELNRIEEQEGGNVKYWFEDRNGDLTASLVSGSLPSEMEIRISTPDDRFEIRGDKSIMERMLPNEFKNKVEQHLKRRKMLV